MKSIYVKDIIKEFGLDVIANEKYINNPVVSKILNNGGLEIFGELVDPKKDKHKIHQRCMILGNKEMHFITKINKKNKVENYNNLFKSYKIPAVFLIDNFKDPDFIKIAKNYSTPIIKVDNSPMHEFTNVLTQYLST